jgi:hypothetical protein
MMMKKENGGPRIAAIIQRILRQPRGRRLIVFYGAVG